MGLCGCKGSTEVTLKSKTLSSNAIRRNDGRRCTADLPTLNEAGRLILEKTMAKKGERGTQMSWLNFLLQKIWPHIHEALKVVVEEDLRPKIQAALPSVLGTVSFKHFSLGNENPQIKEIGVAHGKQNQYDGFELDVKIIWNCIADIVLEVGGIEIGIENVRIDGTVRLQLRPLLPHLPTIGTLTVRK